METRSRQRRPYAARVPPEQRRQQLLDAALAIIVRDGYAAVSIEAVAREAGVTRPVVYSVYDGLGPLLFALLDRQQQRAMAQLARALPGDLAAVPEEVLIGSARKLVETVRNDPATWRPILFAGSDTPPAVQTRIDTDRDLVRAAIAQLMGSWCATRGIRSVDSEVLAHATLAVLEHFGRLLLDDPDRFDADRLLAALRSVLGMWTRK